MLTVLFILIKAAFCVLRDGRGLNALESSEVDTQSSQRAPVFAGNRKKILFNTGVNAVLLQAQQDASCDLRV